jgi:hypothetical protein
MESMAQVQDKLKAQREYTIRLLNQLTVEYQTLKLEMKQISGQYPDSDVGIFANATNNTANFCVVIALASMILWRSLPLRFNHNRP